MPRCRNYPEFTITHQGKTKTVSMLNAALLLTEGATLGDTVLESDATTRPISVSEKQQVMEMASEQQQS